MSNFKSTNIAISYLKSEGWVSFFFRVVNSPTEN